MITDGTPARIDLLTAVLDGTRSVDHVRLTRVELAPGQVPGAHRHPCDVVGAVLAGSIAFQLEGGETATLNAGDAFFEPRDAHVLRFDNADADHPAVFLACYLLGPGETELITMDPVVL